MPARPVSAREIVAALFAFALLAFFIAPFKTADNRVSAPPGAQADAVLGPLLIGSGMDRLQTTPLAYYDTPVLYPDHTQLRGTEPFLGLSLLGLPLRAVGFNDADVFEILRWAIVFFTLIYGFLLFRTLGVSLELSLAGAALCAAQPYLLNGIERIHVLAIPLLIPALYHLVMAWIGPRPIVHSFGLFFFVALYPWGGVINATVALMSVVFILPLVVKLLAAQHRAGRLNASLVPIAAAVVLDAVALIPFLRDRSDLAVYGSDAFLAIKNWNAAPIAVRLSDLSWFARDQIGWGLAFSLVGVGLLVGVRRIQPNHDRPKAVVDPVAVVTRPLVVLCGLAFGLALVSAYPGGELFLRLRVLFQAACYGVLLLYWIRQLKLPLTPDQAGARTFVAALSVGLGVFLCLMSFGPLYVSNRNPLSTHVMTTLLGVLPPLRAIREFKRFWIFGVLFLSIYATIRLDVAARRPLTRLAAAFTIAVAVALAIVNRPLTATIEIKAPEAVYMLASRSLGSGGIYIHPRLEWNTDFGSLMFPTSKLLKRPILNGSLGIAPPWYTYASFVLRSFPSPESLWLLERLGIGTVVSVVGDVGATSQFIQKVYQNPDGVLYELSVPSNAITHPSAGGCDRAGNAVRTPIQWSKTVSQSGASITLTPPDGMAVNAVELSFGQPALEQIPASVDIMAATTTGRVRVNQDESGRWLYSLAADAYVRRQPAVATIRIAEPQRGPLTIDFPHSNQPPIEAIALCGTLTTIP